MLQTNSLNFKQLQHLLRVHDTPSLFLSRHKIRTAYHQLSNALPGVKLYYALKCNAHPVLIHELNQQGCYFDVASNHEVDFALIQQVSANRCIHTHPIKKPSSIEYAIAKGVTTFVVDNENELQKFLPHKNKVRLLFRLAISNKKVFTDLSKKFGILKTRELVNLIRQASKYGFKNLGVCFHPGSQCKTPELVRKALKDCESIIRALHSEGIQISTIDIGGGFPVINDGKNIDINRYCAVFYPQIQALLNAGIEVLAEPGRFLAANCMFLMTRIVGKSIRNGKRWYYLDDGVYNSFSGKVYEHAQYTFQTLDKKMGKRFKSVLAGPTCDSVDVISDNLLLEDLPIDSVLVFDKMGAYSIASATTFNGFSKTKIVILEEN